MSRGSQTSSPPDLPVRIASFGAVVHDGAVYVCGGYRGERHAYSAAFVSGALHRLALPVGASSAWEELPATEPAQGAPLVAHGRHLYRPGGMAARNAPGEAPDLHSSAAVARFDLVQRCWEPFVPLPEPRSSHEACVVGDTLYVAGGWCLAGAGMSGRWINSMQRVRLSEATPRWESVEQPFRRRALAVASWGEEVWCVGGIDADGGPSDAVDVFDTRRGAWRAGPPLPPGPMKGFGCSAVVHEGRLLVSAMKGEVWALEAGAVEWRTVACLRHPRFFHQVVPSGPSEILVVAGEDGDGKRGDIERVVWAA